MAPEPSASQTANGRGICLATPTTENFLAGTLVAVWSFLRAHPRFAGDIAIIHDDLPAQAQELLQALSTRVRLVQVSAELRRRAELVENGVPWLRNIAPHFHAFEAYRLTGYRKLLLCDGDLLFRQPIDELFDTDAALLCCPDSANLRGQYRDKTTFITTDDAANAFAPTFNDGFLLLDAALLGEAGYEALLAMLTPETWPDPNMVHAKQLLHNRYAAGRHTLVSSTYNFLVPYAALIHRREGLTATAAKVLHFNMPVKPWMPEAMLKPRPSPWPTAAFKLWYDAWMDCVADCQLRRQRLHVAQGDMVRKPLPKRAQAASTP